MLNIICALGCEARPLIDHFRLKASKAIKALKLYKGKAYDGKEICLAVCGVGGNAAAAAVGYLAASSCSQSLWLNVGVAAHASCPIGSGFVVNKVTEAASQRSFYPAISLLTKPRPTLPLISVSNPIAEPADSILYDMEAYPFFDAAMRFGSLEHIHLYKVVSDAGYDPKQKLTPSAVEQLISAHIEMIDELVTEVYSLLPSVVELDLTSFTDSFHCTQTELLQLQRALIRWAALYATPFEADLSSFKNFKELLSFLNEKLDEAPFLLNP